jgi:predicted aldo/keto reductase-like oxidoreductase
MGVWDFAQIQINYLDYDIINAKALYDTLAKANVPCVCMEPVRGGFLSDPPEEVRTLMAGFEGGGVTPAGWGFRWCIDKGNMAVILSGMSTMEQVEENIETFSREYTITPAQKEMLAKAADIINGIKAVPCTACRYCMECPSGVEIPEIFRIYNHLKLFKNAFRANEDYQALVKAGNGADQCTRCGACSPKCPQEIHIPDSLEEVKPILENAMRR